MYYEQVSIREIDINITNRCDLRCVHCAFSSDAGDRRELSLDDVKRVVEESMAFGLEDVHLTGGEPTLHQSIEAIMAYVVGKGLTCKLITNGFGLRAGELGRYRDLGLKTVMFSLDGTQDTHNRIRGNPESFQRVIRGIREARELGFGVKVSSVISRMNRGEVCQLVSLMQELGVRVYQFFLYSPTGRNAGRQHDMVLSPREWRDLLDEVKAFVAQHAVTTPEIVAEMGYYWFDGSIDFSAYEGRGGGCYYLGKRCDYLIFLADGSVYSCALLSDKNVALGNIHERSLASILQEPDHADRYRSFCEPTGGCSSCTQWALCKGACRAFAFAYGGVWDGSDPRCLGGKPYIPLCPLYKVNLMTGKEGGYSERVVDEC